MLGGFRARILLICSEIQVVISRVLSTERSNDTLARQRTKRKFKDGKPFPFFENETADAHGGTIRHALSFLSYCATSSKMEYESPWRYRG